MANTLSNKEINLKIDEIENFDFPQDEDFKLKVTHNNVEYDFVVKLSSRNKNLIAFGSGAFSRDRTTSSGKLIKPPYIHRWSWHKYFDESFIAYADPMFYLDDELTLGWYVGEKDWYLEIISKIIEKICINQNISHNNILFFGSSGGGFSSIGLACLIKDSKALVNISSFSVRDISEQHYENLMNVLKRELNLSEEEIIEKINYRLDIIELFKYKHYIPPISYYINYNSELDLNERCMPFLNKILELDEFNNDLSIHFYHDSDETSGGHVPMGNKETINIIKLYSRNNLYNGENKLPVVDSEKRLRKKAIQLKKANEELEKSTNEKPLRKIKSIFKS
ncbi:MAG: hypothetical protein IKF11_02025 [Methanobrevibacter sp.]|nr:hypothetical protein [Methanobrevibacter sp.]